MKISIRLAAISFAVLGTAGLTMIFKEPSNSQLVIDNWNPWLETVAAVILTTIIAAYAVWGAKMDRKCAEDYIFQLITNAAVIAVFTTLTSHAIWNFSLFNEAGLPKPTSGDMVGVMLLSWAMGYGFYRIRGLNS